MAAEKRHALGKGLEALIGDALGDARAASVSSRLDVDIDLIAPNRYQPRAHPGDAGIDGLARSIKSSGLIQPIIVRRTGNTYQIIAGERRWRAAQRAGLLKVPVVIRDVPEGEEAQLLKLALVENLQRENLNPIEEANAYKRLASEFALTQDQIATAVGKDRSSVANILRLLKLPRDVQDEVSAGRLSMGHARALLALEQEQAQRNLARQVVARALSVRETEQLVTHTLARPGAATKTPAPAATVDVHTRAAQDKLSLALGAKVSIVRRGKGGDIRIPFKNEDELQRLYEALTID